MFNHDDRPISVKPGRGPSLVGGVGALAVAGFGVLWTIFAFAITRDAPSAVGTIFPLFGVLFVLLGLGMAAYNFYNAGAKNRMSVVDVTRDEPDPLDPRRRTTAERDEPDRRPGNDGAKFCPQCGKPVDAEYDVCPACGHDL